MDDIHNPNNLYPTFKTQAIIGASINGTIIPSKITVNAAQSSSSIISPTTKQIQKAYTAKLARQLLL
jgi:hypothetical protein